MDAIKTAAAAAVGDTVVMTHTKYRIREIEGGTAQLADAGPNWRRSPIVGAVRVSALRWDSIPAVCRVAG
jgi:hypothetical protein